MFRPIAAIAALTLALTACTAAPASDTVTVFAAASLNSAFPKIAKEVFEPAHPGVEVKFSFEGSSSLAEKIRAGAPADVFASADEKNMDKVGKLARGPQQFTTNTLRLIVPAGNPAGVRDLSSAGKLVVCAPQVPCGRVTQKVAERLGVVLAPVSQEQSVTDVRTKVESGEADAGLVYLTDAKLAGAKVEVVDVPGIADVGTSYMLAALTDTPAAEAFVQAVMSKRGQEILAEHGFGAEARP